MGRRAPLLATAAVLAALVAALHAPVFTRGALITPAGMHHAMWPWRANLAATAAGGALLRENPTLSDLLFQVYPWQLHAARTLSAGTVPLWNPYSYCGVPFVANAQSAVFYPLHWPAWVFPSMRVFTLAMMTKILLAGIFMAIFLRGTGAGSIACVVGSVSFALCGFMTSWLGYAHTNAAVTLPLVLLAARSLARSPGTGGFLLLAVAGAAQHLGGHPETSLHVMAAALLFFLWNLPGSRRPRLAAALFAAGAVAGFLMAAVQMFPFVEYLLDSAALRQRQDLPGMDPSLPIGALVTNILPGLYGRPQDFTFDGPVAYQALVNYTGIATLMLATLSLAWRDGVRFFQALALLSGVVVYGPEAVRSALRHVPVIGISSNNRLTLLISFSVAVLAAHAVQRLGEVAVGSPSRQRLRRGLLPIVAALPLIAVAVMYPSRDPESARLAAMMAGGAAALAALAIFRPGRRPVYLWGVAVIVCFDLFSFAWRFNPHADPGALFPSTPLIDTLRRDAASDMTRGGRMMTVGWTMRPETQMVYRLHSIEGYDAMEIDRYRRLIDRAQVSRIHDTGDIPAASRPLVDLLGLRYVVTPPGGVVSGDDMTLEYDGPDGRIFVNRRALPRFRFVGRAVSGEAAAGDRALEAVAGRMVDPWTTALIEGDEEGGATDAAQDPPDITLERNTTGEIAVTVRGHREAGWLVVADAWDEGWQARVNGERVPVRRADYVFRAVRIPAGEARVTMTYRPPWFRAGAWTSTLTLLFTLALGLARLGRKEGDVA